MPKSTLSVAPVIGTTICPKCQRHGFSFENRGGPYGANTCHWRDCSHHEQVTADHAPRQWTEADIRAIAREEALKVNRGYDHGEPVMNQGTPVEGDEGPIKLPWSPTLEKVMCGDFGPCKNSLNGKHDWEDRGANNPGTPEHPVLGSSRTQKCSLCKLTRTVPSGTPISR
jgi:hypothetical protein